ncbi:MAG: MFS transporter [Bacteroidales bacterium]|nr:MFS transporter [Bacteroidales bacterium]MCI1784806.1 MFS transporter [Bacteroidales bacterium]
MKEKTQRSFNYWQWRVIIGSMIGYSIFYFVRKNFSFAMPSIGREYGITNTSFGIILTLVGLIYGVSKLINGFIADRTNARWHMSIGLLACVILNFIFGWSDHISHWITGQSSGPDFVNTLVVVFAVLLILNNIFQGAGFPPCNRLVTHWVPPEQLATKMSIWNTSHSIGAGLASVLCGYIIASTGNWRWCFWVPAMIGTFGVFFIVATLRDTPKSVGLPELPNTKTTLDDNDTPEAYKKFVAQKVFKNPIIWSLAITDLFVYIVRFAVLDWGPTFLQAGDNPLSPQLAGWTVGIFEVFGCAGMLCAGWITDKFFHGRAQRVCFFDMLLTAACLLVLWLLPKDVNPVIMLIILAIAGFFLYGPQALLGVTASNQATKKAASSAVGLIGLCSYASVIFTGAGLGWFSDHFGWNNLFLLMTFVAIIGGLVILPLWNIKKDGYVHETDSVTDEITNK